MDKAMTQSPSAVDVQRVSDDDLAKFVFSLEIIARNRPTVLDDMTLSIATELLELRKLREALEKAKPAIWAGAHQLDISAQFFAWRQDISLSYEEQDKRGSLAAKHAATLRTLVGGE